MSDTRRQAVIDQAYEEGKVVVYADDTTLQIDVDSDIDLAFAKKMLIQFKTFINYSTCTFTKSKTGGHFHVYINLKNQMHWKHRLHYQACLGSDRTRELLNLLDRLQNESHECFFIEAKDAEHELLKLK